MGILYAVTDGVSILQIVRYTVHHLSKGSKTFQIALSGLITIYLRFTVWVRDWKHFKLLSPSGLIQNSEMLATCMLLQLLNVLWTSGPRSFQPGRTDILGSLLKAWNDSFTRRRRKEKKKKKKAALSLPQCSKAAVPLRVSWPGAGLKPRGAPGLEPELELHSSLKFGGVVLLYIAWRRGPLVYVVTWHPHFWVFFLFVCFVFFCFFGSS